MGGEGVWDIIVVKVMVIKVVVCGRGKKSPSPLGEGGRQQSLSSSRLQLSSILSSCGHHLGREGVGDIVIIEITAAIIAMVTSIIEK